MADPKPGSKERQDKLNEDIARHDAEEKAKREQFEIAPPKDDNDK